MATDDHQTQVEQPGPVGVPVQTAAHASDDSHYPPIEDRTAFRAHYLEHGYVVARGVIPRELCVEARQAFIDEVRPSKAFIHRQASGIPERHSVSEHGFMLNSILNVQDLRATQFGRFRAHALDVITHSKLVEAVQVLFNEPPKLVQSMFFEGNPATWAHQDTYYLDAQQLGGMCAAWVAVENIAPGAGRFYVYDGSHQVDMERNGGDFDVAFNHDRYKRLVRDIITNFKLRCVAPALSAGDVLLWSSKTIHGSLATTEPARSRSSFTAHFVPQSQGLLQYQTRQRQLRLKRINGTLVHFPKSQDRLRNRSMLWLETRLPGPFSLLKRLAIKALVR